MGFNKIRFESQLCLYRFEQYVAGIISLSYVIGEKNRLLSKQNMKQPDLSASLTNSATLETWSNSVYNLGFAQFYNIFSETPKFEDTGRPKMNYKLWNWDFIKLNLSL